MLLSNGQAISVVIVRPSVRLSVCPYVTDVSLPWLMGIGRRGKLFT